MTFFQLNITSLIQIDFIRAGWAGPRSWPQLASFSAKCPGLPLTIWKVLPQILWTLSQENDILPAKHHKPHPDWFHPGGLGWAKKLTQLASFSAKCPGLLLTIWKVLPQILWTLSQENDILPAKHHKPHPDWFHPGGLGLGQEADPARLLLSKVSRSSTHHMKSSPTDPLDLKSGKWHSSS